MQHGSFIIGDVYKQKSHAFFLGIVRHFDQRQGVDGLSNLIKVHKTSMFHPKKVFFICIYATYIEAFSFS